MRRVEASGQKEQHDPFPDPAGGFCQRNKNPAGLGFIGVKYDLLRGNPEGKHSLGGVDPGFDKTKRILKLTTGAGENAPDPGLLCRKAVMFYVQINEDFWGNQTLPG